jgi:hypothetical protein
VHNNNDNNNNINNNNINKNNNNTNQNNENNTVHTFADKPPYIITLLKHIVYACVKKRYNDDYT